MRVAAAAFVAAAIFLAGVMVGLGSGDGGDREAPVAIALVDEGTIATPNARGQEKSNVENVQHPAKKGEVDDKSGAGGDEAEYWEEEDEDNSGPGSGDDSEDDSSGPGSGGDDSSGPGSGGDDNSGSGSGSSGSGSDGSGDSSGPG